jgi:amidase
VEAAIHQLDRIAAVDGELASFALVTPESAIAEAREAEAHIAAGHYRGPLHGVPLAVKDLFWTRGTPTAAGMTIHIHFKPGEDATVVRRLRQAGAVLLGKLQMDRGRLFRPPSASHAAPESMERRTVLWRARLRHRRLHSLALGGERAHRSQAHLGAREPPRRVRPRAQS